MWAGRTECLHTEPGGLLAQTGEDARNAIAHAKSILEFCRSQIRES
jgi:hypothetical protein